jgi:hypothetical protein
MIIYLYYIYTVIYIVIYSYIYIVIYICSYTYWQFQVNCCDEWIYVS